MNCLLASNIDVARVDFYERAEIDDSYRRHNNNWRTIDAYAVSLWQPSLHGSRRAYG
jgi:hypothetical protein